MHPIQIYAVAAGGTFSLLALVHLPPYVIPFFTRVSLFISNHLTYPYVLHRYHILGPWTRAGVAMYYSTSQSTYSVSPSSTCRGTASASAFAEAGRRASTLAMVNMTDRDMQAHFDYPLI
ncbi:hypothetical protein OIDMADRAFT_183721 [Oidiodendron maius Zn]|uniref:Uncharacterized protein n=1 Tax=Oidiodendron maius (strain Zn) TaxID=913774 RepID=A0A0C3C9Y4_OIDMZ|nr:hypothetical protein OIDMADRAFT_183721 [Oidiodendron maius Zn]